MSMDLDGIYEEGELFISTRVSASRKLLPWTACPRLADSLHLRRVMISVLLFFCLMMDKAAATPSKPKWLNPCHRSDPLLAECLQTSINTIIKALRCGQPDMGLPALDPIELPYIELEQVAGANVTLRLRHTIITGLADVRVVNVKPNLEENKLEIAIKCPNGTAVGNFMSEGGILLMPIVSQGDYVIKIDDISGMVIIYFGRNDTSKVLEVDKMYVDIMPSSVFYHFGEELDGDNELGRVANEFYNENALEFFKLVKPNILRGLTEVFTSFSNQVLSAFPENMLLPP